MVKNMEMIKEAGALAPEPLMLSDETSLWGSDIYISGTFLTKVFEGPYRNMSKWVKQMKSFVESKGKEMKKMYFFYTTCPRCAKFYGKNYTVLLAEV